MLNLLPLVGIALLFWLFIIRPASRRQRELGRMQSSLSVGDQIVLTSGIYGSVVAAEDDHLVVEISDGVTVKVARGAVGTIVPRQDPLDELDDNEPYDGLDTRPDAGPDAGPDGSKEA